MERSWNMAGALAVIVLAAAAYPAPCFAGASTPETLAEHIAVQNSASARIELDGKTIYVDPFFDESEPAPAADLILVTHGHDRHCSAPTVARILKPTTAIVAPESCAAQLRQVAQRAVTPAVPGKAVDAAGFNVEPVAAYTPEHADHAKGTGGVGYVVTVGGVRVYHSGSTALVPELRKVRADVALIAFWEGYILSTADAAEVARSLGAKVVIPIHCKPEEALKLRDMLQPAIRVDVKQKPQA